MGVVYQNFLPLSGEHFIQNLLLNSVNIQRPEKAKRLFLDQEYSSVLRSLIGQLCFKEPAKENGIFVSLEQ